MSFAGWEQQEARRLNESAAEKTARADGSKFRNREGQATLPEANSPTLAQMITPPIGREDGKSG